MTTLSAASAAASKLLSRRGPAFVLTRSFAVQPISTPGRGPPVTNPADVVFQPEDLRKMNRTGEESMYKLGKHRSNALELVQRVPPVEVDGEMAICDGGGGAMGHPVEYISLKVPGAVEPCKYCALRFTQKKKNSSHGH
ncbi:hypothetical protein MPSEU_000745400 [Mayamaea pseudoterrestris]|nr:hypothetical protein MPSEU_000745400 [Mayamaea pseudoterrestris]